MTNLNQHHIDAMQDRYGLKIAARLSDSAETLPYDISERLRAARVQALSRRKVVQLRAATAVSMSGGAATLSFGDEGIKAWGRLASLLPLVALVAGLIAINIVQDNNRANELADIDSALLTDDLPTAAYTDAGFMQFIKSPTLSPTH